MCEYTNRPRKFGSDLIPFPRGDLWLLTIVQLVLTTLCRDKPVLLPFPNFRSTRVHCTSECGKDGGPQTVVVAVAMLCYILQKI